MPYLLDKKNQVTKIVDTFTPVHDGAVFANAFAYQVDKGQFGKMTFFRYYGRDTYGICNIFYYCLSECEASYSKGIYYNP